MKKVTSKRLTPEQREDLKALVRRATVRPGIGDLSRDAREWPGAVGAMRVQLRTIRIISN